MTLRSVKNILFLAVIFPSQKVPPLHPPLMPFRGPYLFPHNPRPLPVRSPDRSIVVKNIFGRCFFLVTKNPPLPIPWPHSSLSPRHLAIGQIQRFLHHTNTDMRRHALQPLQTSSLQTSSSSSERTCSISIGFLCRHGWEELRINSSPRAPNSNKRKLAQKFWPWGRTSSPRPLLRRLFSPVLLKSWK